jgi:NTE family protein
MNTSRIVRCGTGLLCAGLAGCAHVGTPKLDTYDLKAGYRFEQLPKSLPSAPPKNTDDIFVVLAFSGGGTRAAALSTGVMQQLANVTFHLNPSTGAPCTPGPSDPGCETTPRSLLDEVDVISSVSGGSFVAAYYALKGADIFSKTGRFQRDFLYYPLQRDLFAQAVFYPTSWPYLGTRTEIATRLYDKRIFEKAKFGALAQRARPYIILNGTDTTTGARFEFTQEQFDLLCSDLSRTPIARGVTGSSAFPGLLNSLTIESHNKAGCHYTGPGSRVGEDWVPDALEDRDLNQRRYRKAQTVLAYRDPTRTYLHILDGGLADNIGLRSVIQSLSSRDRPVQRNAGGDRTLGGWSLLSMVNNRKVKTLVVITVNARTRHDSNADTHAAGPSTFGVLGAASGIPMGNFSTDTLALFQSTLVEFVEPQALANLNTLAVEVAFEDLDDDLDPAQSERSFFSNLPTTFELLPFEVDCLISRGGRLLKGAVSVERKEPKTFSDFVVTDLKGQVGSPGGPQPGACTRAAAKKAGGIRTHYIDVGAEFGSFAWHSGDVKHHQGPGVAFRITRPNGLSAIADYSSQSFALSDSVSGVDGSLGDLTQRMVLGGVAYTQRLSQLEATIGFALGYGFGSFDLSASARDAYARQGVFGVTSKASDELVLAPRVSLWQNLTNRWAVGVTAKYLHSKPTVTLTSGDVVRTQDVDASALRVSAGIGFKVF